MIMLVREIGLNWLHSDIGDSFGTGLILASFHICGTYCSSRERLNNLVINEARYRPKSFHNHKGNSSGPEAVRFTLVFG